jgi:hypothetical protein
MRTDFLSVALVEEVHRAVLAGKDVIGVVSGLRAATLPGFLEYGCLRWAMGNGTLPPLPEAITVSDLGRALNAVPSILGLRSSGHHKRSLRRLDPQSAEFHVLHAQEDLACEDWDHFANRFEASARWVGFSFAVAARLQLALYEMAENAVIHAASPAILVGYEALPGKALFCVADVGVGVMASLRKNPALSSLKLHNEAIRAALQDGVTSQRLNEGGGGFGFRQVFTSLADQWGSLRFRSGEGCITMDGIGPDANQGNVTHPPPLPGFQVTICCRTEAPRPIDRQAVLQI